MVAQTLPLLEFLAASRANRHAVLSVQRAVEVSWYVPVNLVSVHARNMHVKSVLGDKPGVAVCAAVGGLLSWGRNVLRLGQNVLHVLKQIWKRGDVHRFARGSCLLRLRSLGARGVEQGEPVASRIYDGRQLGWGVGRAPESQSPQPGTHAFPQFVHWVLNRMQPEQVSGRYPTHMDRLI